MFKLIVLWLTANKKTRDAAISVLEGKCHARTFPKKRGDKGFSLVEGVKG